MCRQHAVKYPNAADRIDANGPVAWSSPFVAFTRSGSELDSACYCIIKSQLPGTFPFLRRDMGMEHLGCRPEQKCLYPFRGHVSAKGIERA